MKRPQGNSLPACLSACMTTRTVSICMPALLLQNVGVSVDAEAKQKVHPVPCTFRNEAVTWSVCEHEVSEQ